MTAAPTDVITLPDDDEEEPRKSTGGEGRTSTVPRSFARRVPSGQSSHPLPEVVPQEQGGSSRAGAISVSPLSTALPLVSTLLASGPIGQPQVLIPPTASPTPPPHVFTLHHVPEDQTGASKEATIQAGLMMQRLKEVYEANKLAYDASTAPQANV